MSAAERFEVVVGVEVHAQLATRTKLFCGCAPAFGAPPNTHTCPVCLGLPGALPVLNREAFELCALTALALGCEVPEVTTFDRKNYYYPDQPKNYQISQSYHPLGTGGALTLMSSGNSVRIDNVHLEEDAGKLLHDETGREGSTVDLNRSGTPLAEIVSRPDLRSLDEVDDYMETLRLTLLHLGVSRCRMEEGNLRFEASISLRDHGESALGTRVEIKNLNSTKAVRAGLAYEIERQAKLLAEGGAVEQETRLWDEAAAVTRRMRSKEEAHDYRYFPEPDLAPVRVSSAWRDELRGRLAELPTARRQRYIEALGLPAYDATVLVSDPKLASFFEELAARLGDAKVAANWMMNDVLAQLNARGLDLDGFPVTPEALAELIGLVQGGAVSGQAARLTVLPAMIDERRAPREVIRERGLEQESCAQKLLETVETVLEENPGPVQQFLAGKKQVVGFLIGQCMKSSRGRGNPKVFADLLGRALARRGG